LPIGEVPACPGTEPLRRVTRRPGGEKVPDEMSRSPLLWQSAG
jgi:hypothetical protein